VANVDRSATPQEIISLFSVHGEVLDTYFAQSSCHIRYNTIEECKSAIRDKDKSWFKGKPLTVRMTEERENFIIVRNLLPGLDSTDLLFKFSVYGRILNLCDIKKVLNKVVFIEYESRLEALMAIRGEDGKQYYGQPLRVKLAYGSSDKISASTNVNCDYPSQLSLEDEPRSHHTDQSRGPRDNPIRPNVVEILCGKPETLEFGESIKGQLLEAGIPSVGLTPPTTGFTFQQIFDRMGNRGVEFACIFTPKDVTERTLSVKCLTKDASVMDVPVAEAVDFVKINFFGMQVDPEAYAPSTEIRMISGFISNRRELSIAEYDKMISFMVEYRENKLKETYGTKIPAQLLEPPLQLNKDPVLKNKQEEIQSALLDLLEENRGVLSINGSLRPPRPSLSQGQGLLPLAAGFGDLGGPSNQNQVGLNQQFQPKRSRSARDCPKSTAEDRSGRNARAPRLLEQSSHQDNFEAALSHFIRDQKMASNK